MRSTRFALAAIAIVFATMVSADDGGLDAKAPQTPTVALRNLDGTLLTLQGRPVVVPVVVDHRGYPVFGPDGKMVPTPIAYDEVGKPIVVDGGPVLLTGVKHPRALLRTPAGRLITDNVGRPLTAEALVGDDGRPVRNPDGSLVPLSVKLDATGDVYLDQSGNTVLSAPDIPDKLPVLGSNGLPIIGPSGEPLLIPIKRDDDGRPILGSDGRSVRMPYKTDVSGRPQLGVDGQPVPASSREEAIESIYPIADSGFLFGGSSVLLALVVAIAIIGMIFYGLHLLHRIWKEGSAE